MSELYKIINNKIKELTTSYEIKESSFDSREEKIKELYKKYETYEKYEIIEEKDIQALEKKKTIINDSPIYHFCSLRAIKKIVDNYLNASIFVISILPYRYTPC